MRRSNASTVASIKLAAYIEMSSSKRSFFLFFLIKEDTLSLAADKQTDILTWNDGHDKTQTPNKNEANFGRLLVEFSVAERRGYT